MFPRVLLLAVLGLTQLASAMQSAHALRGKAAVTVTCPPAKKQEGTLSCGAAALLTIANALGVKSTSGVCGKHGSSEDCNTPLRVELNGKVGLSHDAEAVVYRRTSGQLHNVKLAQVFVTKK